MRKWLPLAVMILAVSSASASASSPSLPPTEGHLRYALVVGNNKGPTDLPPLHYAEQDAQKFTRTLVELGKFQKKRLRLLQGAQAPRVWKELRRFRKILQQHKRTPFPTPTLFLFYYSGHARNGSLFLGKSRISIWSLYRFLSKCGATVRIAILDSCQSGSILQAKGFRRTKALFSPPPRWVGDGSQIIIASSRRYEQAHEDPTIRGAVFTHYFVSALRGKGDRNEDRRISLEEAFRYSYRRTLLHTGLRGRSQHPLIDGTSKDLILTSLDQVRSALVFPGPIAGTYRILSTDRRIVLAEVTADTKKPVRVALAPGKYLLEYRSESSRSRAYNQTLNMDQEIWISQEGRQRIRRPFQPNKEKSPPLINRSWGLSASGGLQSNTSGWFLPAISLELGKGNRGWHWPIRLQTASSVGQKENLAAEQTGLTEFALETGPAFRWIFGSWNFSLGGMMGVPLVLSSVRNNPLSFQLGARIGLGTTLQYTLSPDWFIGLEAILATQILLQKENLLYSSLLRLSCSLGYRF